MQIESIETVQKHLLKYLTSVFVYLTFFSFLNAYGQMSYVFVENKNQWDGRVLYKADIPGGRLFIEKNGFTYNFVKQDDIKKSAAHNKFQPAKKDTNNSIRYHAYKVEFQNSLKDAFVSGTDAASDYVNYFRGSDKSKWASRVRRFNSISYKNIYKNIDLKLYVANQELKYDFVVRKGASVADISMKYIDAGKVTLAENGNIQIITSVNEVQELKPYAYQNINGKEKQVPCSYLLKDNIVSFSFPEGYNKNYELVIDPQLIFSTYTGSTTDNWGFTATYDAYGNVYSGGIVENDGYPVNTGAYQLTAAGFWDIGIIKYNPSGTQRLFATYIGGNYAEMPHSLVVNEMNQLNIFGTTGSNNFPTTFGAYDTSFNGGDQLIYDNTVQFPRGTDIYVSKLSENGDMLLGSTYIGGSGNDGMNYKPYLDQNGSLMHGNDSLYFNYGDGARGEIITDARSNIYIGTSTFSNNFPVTAGAFQTNHRGKQEGVIFKLSSNFNSLIWSSYIGGTADDGVYSVDIDSTLNVYIAGGTASQNFPTTPGSIHQTYMGGSTDAFVAKISANGSSLLKSTFWGAGSYDQAYFVRLDKQRNVFIAGQTKASGTTLIYNALYNRPNSGQFITKLNNNLDNIVWSTVFGTGDGKPNISITAFTVDVCNRIYLSGWGRIWGNYVVEGVPMPWGSTFGTKGMDITSNAFQDSTDGQDFYLMVMAGDASQLDYATYFGEIVYDACYYSGHDHVDGGTSRFDRKGNIYQSVCASCNSCQKFPTYPNPGAFSNSNNSYNCNNAVFRFSFAENFVVADFIPPTGTCIGNTLTFTNTSIGNSFLWNFGDGATSTLQNPTHTYSSEGSYTVTLIVRNPSSCNLSDTIQKTIEIFSSSRDTLATITVCTGDTVQIGEAPGSNPNVQYQWFPPTGLSNPNISNPHVVVSQNAQYILVKNNNGCRDTLVQNIEVTTQSYTIRAINDTLVCNGGNLVLNATASGTTLSYLWSTNRDFTSHFNSNTSQSYTSIVPTSAGWYYVKGDGAGCFGTAIDSVFVNVGAIAIKAWPDTTICSGVRIFLHAQSLISGENLTYSWSPASQIVSGSNTANPEIGPTENTLFFVTAVNSAGCVDVDTVVVNVNNISATVTNIRNVRCNGVCDGILLANGTGNGSLQYIWSNGSTGQTVNSLCAGTYFVTVKDNRGCKKTATATITEPPVMGVNYSKTDIPVCNGLCSGSASISASGGTPPFEYYWSNGVSGPSISDLCAGTYSVTVSDYHNCDSVVNVVISDGSNFNISIITDSASCFGVCDGSMSVNPVSAQEPVNYSWSNNNVGSTIAGLCYGNYTVTAIDNQNCVRIASGSIRSLPDIGLGIFSSGSVKCHNDTFSLIATTVNGSRPFQYNWGNSTNSDSVLHGVAPGSYFLEVVDNNGCRDSINIMINNPERFISDSLKTKSVCTKACNGSIDLGLKGGARPYSVVWDDGSNDTLRLNLCQGNYYVTITDASGCKKIQSYKVDTLNYRPMLDVTADSIVVVRGKSTYLHAVSSKSDSYLWVPSKWLSSNSAKDPRTTPDSTITYRVFTTDSTGCSNTDTITIFVKDVLCREPYIFVPNGFTPNDDGNNDKLYVFTAMAKELYFAVYDRWGEKVFETTKVSEGWDGSFKGQKLEPAVFVYYLRIVCVDNVVFEKKGNITLLK